MLAGNDRAVTDDLPANGSPDADVLAFLARLEAENPSAAETAVAKEIDRLLGRRSPQPSKRPRAAIDPDDRRVASTAFEWYQAIVARLPPVLDADRTVEAAWWVEAGLFAEERLDSDELIPRHIRWQLRRVAQKGRDEFELLVRANLRLVFHWSKGVASSIGEDWVQDAFQAGCLGLIRGLQGWDYQIGYQLSTFVSWHIRQHIQRWRTNEVALIRIPVHVWERLESSPESLSPQVLDAAQKALALISLDVDEIPIDEMVSADHAVDRLDERALAIERRKAVDRLLSQLDDRSATIIRLRQGLGSAGEEPLTLDAIGEMYGVTRERIRQIEKKAMEKLTSLATDIGLDELI